MENNMQCCPVCGALYIKEKPKIYCEHIYVGTQAKDRGSEFGKTEFECCVKLTGLGDKILREMSDKPNKDKQNSEMDKESKQELINSGLIGLFEKVAVNESKMIEILKVVSDELGEIKEILKDIKIT